MTTNRLAKWTLFATIAAASSWLLFAKALVPSVIESAYRGESLPFLNRILEGQTAANPSAHSLEYYLSDWNRITNRTLVFLVAAGTLFFLVTHPRFQRYWDARHPLPAENLKTMTTGRVRLVYALAAFLTFGHLFAIAADMEHRPFSQYPMFQHIGERTTSELRFYGITSEGEIALAVSPYFNPFQGERLKSALLALRSRRKRTEALDKALRNCLELYDASRRDGLHEGPPLQGLRLYEFKWRIDPWARNVDRPDAVDFIHEVRVR